MHRPPVTLESAFRAVVDALPHGVVITRLDWGDWRVSDGERTAQSADLLAAIEMYQRGDKG